MNRLRILPFAILALALLAAPSLAQDEDYRDSEGYFDFGDIVQFSDGEEMVEIDLMQPFLGLVAGLMGSEDPEVSSVLENLLLVNIRVFSFDRDEEENLSEHIDKLSGRLNKDKWERIVRARGSDENVNIYVMMSNAQRGKPANDDTAIEGLVILIKDEYEAIFANVVGHFGTDEIALLGRHFDIPHMDDFSDGPRRRSRRSSGDDDDDNDN